MSGVLSIGYKSEAFVSGQQDIPCFNKVVTREDYDLLVDTVSELISTHGHALAIYPGWAPEPALQRLETVRSALHTSKLAVYGSKLPPLAGGVFVALASAVVPYVASPGLLVGGLPALERELVVIAWLGSVSGLSTPSPSLWMHILSLWPSTSFGVSFWPEPQVRLLLKNDRSVPVPTTYRPMLLAVSARNGDSEWVEGVVARALGSPPVKRYEPTPLGGSWWGTPKLVEGVAYPVDVPVTARRIVHGLQSFVCRWCGEAIATPICPFCGLETTEAPLARLPGGGTP